MSAAEDFSDADEADDLDALSPVTTDHLTALRRRCGPQGWTFWEGGARISERALIERWVRLGVPPAYTEARYARDPRAHLQAVARDAAGRLQYFYHPDWEKVRSKRKRQRLERLAQALPRLRKTLTQDLARGVGDERFTLALATRLIDVTGARVGSERYVALSGSRGVATLMKSHVRAVQEGALLRFRAKGGKAARLLVEDPMLVQMLLEQRGAGGRRLFSFRNTLGAWAPVTAARINHYLCEAANVDISAKTLRAWRANVVAAEAARDALAMPSAKRLIYVLDKAAAQLNDTRAVTRKSYVLPDLADAIRTGAFPANEHWHGRVRAAMTREETALARYLGAG